MNEYELRCDDSPEAKRIIAEIDLRMERMRFMRLKADALTPRNYWAPKD